MDLADLYSEQILHFAANAPQPSRLSHPHASARKVSRICGSVVEVDLVIEDGVVSAYGHKVSACVLGQTSAAVVAREIVGTRVEDFLSLRQQMLAMLKIGGVAPSGRWSDLALLAPARDYPARHQSVMLVFDAIADALEKVASVTGLRPPLDE
jgi:NifU-like protein involved in Fe-S cluster formation